MNVLVIESTSQLCLVVLKVNDQVYERSISGVRSHSEYLLNFIHALLSDANISLDALDAIAYSAGPGSFTGVRLAASTAKSLAYAINKPVILLSSLQVLAASFFEQDETASRVSVLMDARMGDVYYSHYESKLDTTVSLHGDHILSVADPALSKIASPIIGDAQHLFESLRIDSITPSSTALIALAEKAFKAGETMQAFDANPIYLRDKSSWKTLEEQQKTKV